MLICFVKLNDTRYLLISEFKKKTYQLSVIFYLGVYPKEKSGSGCSFYLFILKKPTLHQKHKRVGFFKIKRMSLPSLTQKTLLKAKAACVEAAFILI